MKLRTWLIAGAAVAVAAALLVGAFPAARARLRDWSYPSAAVMPPEVAGTMEDVLSRLQAALAKSAPETLAALEPGLSESRIRDLEKDGGFELSPDLRALYQWRNGTLAESPVDFIPGHRFPSLEHVVEQRKALADQLEEATALQQAAHTVLAGHRAPWIPLLEGWSGRRLLFRPCAVAGTRGGIFQLCRNRGLCLLSFRQEPLCRHRGVF